MIWLSYGEVYETLFWVLNLIMSQNKKHYLLRVVAKLVEARNFQHLPKIRISLYLPVHFSCYYQICTPLSKLERVGVVGCARKNYRVF